MNKLIPIFFVLFLLASITNAHGLGQSFEREVNGYSMDIGYSAVDNIHTGEIIRFDFNLWDAGQTNVADFNHVWVRISPSDVGLSFASYLYYPAPLLTGLSYTFEKGGQYDLTVRFLDKDNNSMAEASFPLEVFDDIDSTIPIATIVGSIVGIIIGAGVAFYAMRRRSQNIDI